MMDSGNDDDGNGINDFYADNEDTDRDITLQWIYILYAENGFCYQFQLH